MKDVKKIKIVAFPKDPNPYQDLLYDELKDQIELTYFSPTISSPFGLFTFLPKIIVSLIKFRFRGYHILHIHFIYPFYLPKKLPFYRLISYINASIFLSTINFIGFKVVWTVHNLVPQSSMTINDHRLMRKLAKTADAKIVHTPGIIEDMRLLNISTKNTTVVPIGSYSNIYPDSITARQARRQLNIKSSEFVILFFGIISRYKGVEDLIDVFKKLKIKNTRLVIVGHCASLELKHKIESAANQPNIDFYEGYVPTEDVATYFKASDIVCLPFRKITTSSSTILALSFAKPVVVPLLGTLRELPSSVGYFYDASIDGLENAVLQASTHQKTLPEMGKMAKEYSDSLSWDKIADKTYSVYSELF
jgi:glycosyltransferase involved in cell wall biosynthesis